MGTYAEALSVLKTYAGLNDAAADALLKAVKDAVEDEVLDTIAGSGPLPTAVMDLRALRLRRICERAGRLLRTREVEVVFRVPSSTAETIDRRMRSTYPQSIDAYMRNLVRETATVKKAGTDAEPRYELSFDEPAGLEHARVLLGRAGLTRDVKTNKATLTLNVPTRMGPVRARLDPLDVLGVDKP